ncbi:hypothetical protein [Flavobacterium sp.]|uniref:hypothetical protein n=1 Tax=Flavobacterium sp. TaxID=239 RepID=UPI00374CD6EA
MIEIGLNGGLNRGFFKKISLRNFVKLNKAMIAPHTLINKKDRKKGFGLIKKVTQVGFAPHTLLRKKTRQQLVKGTFAPRTLLRNIQ